MKKSALSTVIAVLLVMVFVLASCAQPAPPAAKATIAPAAPVAPAVKEAVAPAKEALPALKEAAPLATKPYGTVTVALDTLQEESFDPAISTGNNAANVCRAVIDKLIESEGGKTIPGIAESWEIASDGMSWTFHLRQGVKFSNGDPLTARDVKFSIDYTMPVHMYPQLRNEVARVEVVDPYTLRIHTKFLAPFLYADLSVSGCVLPSDYIKRVGMDAWKKNPIGSGPWLFQRQVYQDFIEYKAREEHWRQVPAFEHLKLLTIPEEATRVAALQVGQVDMINLGLEASRSLKGEGLRAVISQATMVSYILFGVYRPEVQSLPLGDKRVRQALSLAINRQEIIDEMFYGLAEFPVPYPMTGRSAGDMDDIGRDYVEKLAKEAYRYDPVAAKKLLAEAGYPQGFSLNFYSYRLTYAPSMPQVAEVVAAYWKAIGVNATLRPVEWVAIAGWRNSNADICAGTAAIYAAGAGGERSSARRLQMGPGDFAPMIMGAPAPKNGLPRIQELAAQIESEPDASKRGVMTREVMGIITPEYFWPNLAAVPAMVGLGPRIDVEVPLGTGNIGEVFEYIKHRE